MGGKQTAVLETPAEKEVFCFVVVCLFFNDGSVFVNDLVETQIVLCGPRTFVQGKGGKPHGWCWGLAGVLCQLFLVTQ